MPACMHACLHACLTGCIQADSILPAWVATRNGMHVAAAFCQPTEARVT
jgi:hypothetical protein